MSLASYTTTSNITNSAKSHRYQELLSNNNNNSKNQLNYNLIGMKSGIHNTVNGNFAIMNCMSNGHSDNGPTNTSTSSSISSMSDIDIDDTHIKEEPLSPHSSCPSSPNSQSHYKCHSNNVYFNSHGQTSINMSTNMMSYGHNGNLQLPSNAQSLLKSQQLIIGSTSSPSNRGLIPKSTIKQEHQVSCELQLINWIFKN